MSQSAPIPSISILAENRIFHEQGQKRCRKCLVIKNELCFYRKKDCQFGIDPNCIDCELDRHIEIYNRNHEVVKVKRREYGFKNRATITSRKRVYLQTLKSEHPEKYKARCQYQNLEKAMTRCVDTAKTSPIHKREGFTVVRNQEGVLRAAVGNKPVLPGERVIINYTYNAAIKTWFALAPVVTGVLTAEEKRLCQNFIRREKRVAGGRR